MTIFNWVGNNTDGGGGSGTDPNAIHDNVANEINPITGKSTPVGDDVLIIEDSADSFNKKSLKVSDIPGAGGGEANTTSSAGGESLVLSKVGVNLPFKGLAPTSSKIAITNTSTTVNIDVNETNLTLTESQISDLAHTTSAADLISGVLADARVQQSNVTQHQAALSISESQISDLSHVDTTAIHKATSSELSAMTAKATPIGADILLMEDSAASNAKKKFTLQDISFAPVQKSRILTVTSTDATITNTDGYDVVRVITGATNRTINLVASSGNVGRDITIIKVDSGVGQVLITASGIESINGRVTQRLYKLYGKATLICVTGGYNFLSEPTETGTYTPTLTGITAITTVTVANTHWFYKRVGDFVRVWGAINWTASSGGSGEFSSARASLPIPPLNNFTNGSSDAVGSALKSQSGTTVLATGHVEGFNTGSTNEAGIGISNLIGTSAIVLQIGFNYTLNP